MPTGKEEALNAAHDQLVRARDEAIAVISVDWRRATNPRQAFAKWNDAVEDVVKLQRALDIVAPLRPADPRAMIA